MTVKEDVPSAKKMLNDVLENLEGVE